MSSASPVWIWAVRASISTRSKSTCFAVSSIAVRSSARWSSRCLRSSSFPSTAARSASTFARPSSRLELLFAGVEPGFLGAHFLDSLLHAVLELVLDLDKHFSRELDLVERDGAVGKEGDGQGVAPDRLAMVLRDLDWLLDRVQDPGLHGLVVGDLARRIQGEFPEHSPVLVHKEGLCGPPALSLHEHGNPQEDSG